MFFCGDIIPYIKLDDLSIIGEVQGTPIVTYIRKYRQLGGIEDLSSYVDMVDDGNTGFLSYDLTTESYIKAIERFLALSDNEIESMKRKCKDASQQYTIERCAAQYEILFSK